ncbi:uncharacterized protein V1518DRAFT_411139 [Limtongia smithiae]|uniref:uncharacterized protein n=1 Tax=Limtongia smithiae TaxID=1125753 RepID=UPI0034CFC26B
MPRIKLTFLTGVAASIALFVCYSILQPELMPATMVVSGLRATQDVVAPVDVSRYRIAARENNCENPYAQDGFLYFQTPNDLATAQYFPFYTLDRDGAAEEDPDKVIGGHRYFGGNTVPRPSSVAYASAPHNWYADLRALRQQYQQHTNRRLRIALEQRVAWMRNRTVLFIGDSTDRFLSFYMCQWGLGGKLHMAPEGMHSASHCNIPFLNFTIITWHVASVYETRPEWWIVQKMKLVSWEDRWREFYMPSLVKGDYAGHGTARVRPDMVVVQSGLWDHLMFMFARHAQKGMEAKTQAQKNAMKAAAVDHTLPLNYRELRYYIRRMDKILSDVMTEFPDTPLVCRSLTQRHDGVENAGIHQLEQALAYACRKRDVEMMPFGRIVRGLMGVKNMYADRVHFREGVISSVYDNIMLWYLHRAAGGVEQRGKLVVNASTEPTSIESWNRCHSYFMLDSA